MIPSGDETPSSSSPGPVSPSAPAPEPSSPDGDRSNASPRGAPGAPARGLLLLAVLLTGATSLAYEVAWTRGLVLVLGTTAVTTTVVLAVFVGSLGLGARWGGVRADRSTRPLGLYGLLELLAAVWAVLALGLAGLLLTPCAAIAGALPEALRFVLRVLLGVLVVAPGAFLLGATLPALVRWWTGGLPGTGRGTAWVYGVNTLGAFLGALASGFYGVAWLGVDGWLLLAAGVAGFVGLTALGAARTRPPATPVAPAPVPATAWMPLRPAFAAAALCGGLGLGLEVAGFRILVFFVEGFTATFAAMLGVFILGLGLGSLLLGPWLARSRNPHRPLGLLLLLAGLAVCTTLGLVLPNLEDVLKGVRDAVYAGASSEADIQEALHLTALLGAAALFLVPALLLGSTFALCVRWAELGGLAAGRSVGRIYLWNSAGTVVAPFLVGFLMVPAAGPTGAYFLLAAACAVGAMHTLIAPATFAGARAVRGLLGVFLFLLVAVLPFAFGPQTTKDLVGYSHILHGRPERHLVEVRCDELTTAGVVEEADGEKVLYTDDFAAAATGRHYRYMRMLGHLPVLLAKDPKRAMVIAFGTGTTAGAVARHAGVETIEVVEVSRAVYELAPHFAEANRKVLEDKPRVVEILDDGRNALLLHDADLDVITLEPLMPYSPAGLPFYTKEFYELAKARLRDGGVLCQWLPVHAMPAGLYAALVRTFFEVFPDGQLWFFEQSSALIAVKGEGTSREAFEARATAVQADLAAAGFTTPDLVLSAYLASGETVRKAPVPPSPWTDRVVTDLDPFPEFHPTPRASLNTSYLKDTLAYLATLVKTKDVSPLTRPDDRDAAMHRQGAAEALGGRAAGALAEWSEVAARGFPPGSPERAGLKGQALRAWQAATRWYVQAMIHLPGETVIAWRRARAQRRAMELEVADLLARAKQARDAGTGEEDNLLQAALALARAAVDRDAPHDQPAEAALAQCWVAAVFAHMGRCDRAEEVLDAAARRTTPLTPEGRRLATVRSRLQAHRVGTSRGLFAGAPPCGHEGAALVDEPLQRWREALALGRARAIRLAADNVVAATRRVGVEEEVLALLREDEPPASPMGRAAWAGILAVLDPKDVALRDLLRDASKAQRLAALAEAGRKQVLRRWPAVGTSFAEAADPDERGAFASAADADGDVALLRRAAGLLMDEAEAVRAATATALLKRFPEEIEAYDPMGPAPARRKATDAILAKLKP